MSRILVVDDERSICQTLRLHLGRGGHDVRLAHNAEDGLKMAKRYQSEILVLDNRMPGMDGLEALPLFKEQNRHLFVIMVTAFHDMETTIRAMHKGALEFIHKPIDIGELQAAIAKAENYRHSLKEQPGLEVGKVGVESRQENTIIADKPTMKAVFNTIKLLCLETSLDCPILILGEIGTGKKTVAKMMHRAIHSGTAPFTVVNCAAILARQMDSDSPTSALAFWLLEGIANPVPAEISLASTLFLDEVERLPANVQTLLAGQLQPRVDDGLRGGTLKNHRIIASSCEDLNHAVAKGLFRKDLLDQLGLITLRLPPLRNMRDGIPALVERLLIKINRETGRHVTTIPTSVMDRLINASWPGNIRQLENTLMKAVVLCRSERLSLEDLPDLHPDHPHPGQVPGNQEEQDDSLVAVEKRQIVRILRKTGWHKGKSCELLGITRPRLDRKIKQYNIRRI